MSSNDQSAMLTVHPSTPNHAVRSLGVRVRSEESSILIFQYSLKADLSRLRVPPSEAGGRADFLWKHTCFEAFVGSADAAGYHEFNFSPSLNWAVYRFSAHREGMSPAEVDRPPEISVHRGDDGLEIQSVVRLAQLPALSGAPYLKVAMAAVIEQNDGSMSYWGLRHAPGAPDFHDPYGFALEVTLA